MPYKSKRARKIAYKRFIENNPGYTARARAKYVKKYPNRVKKQRKNALFRSRAYNLEWYKKLKRKKLCVSCGNPREIDFVRCHKCRLYHNIHSKASKEKKKQEALKAIAKHEALLRSADEKIRIALAKGFN